MAPFLYLNVAPILTVVLCVAALYRTYRSKSGGTILAWHGLAVALFGWMLGRWMLSVYAAVRFEGVVRLHIFSTDALIDEYLGFTARNGWAAFGAACVLVAVAGVGIARRRNARRG